MRTAILLLFALTLCIPAFADNNTQTVMNKAKIQRLEKAELDYRMSEMGSVQANPLRPADTPSAIFTDNEKNRDGENPSKNPMAELLADPERPCAGLACQIQAMARFQKISPREA